MPTKQNIDPKVVRDFGDEWNSYKQDTLPASDLEEEFENYFCLVDFDALPKNCHAADIGCGSGRWAKFVAPKVAHLTCVDPSSAIAVARENLTAFDNVTFENTDIANLPFEDESLDFAYSLGVLHHLPDTQEGMKAIHKKVKKGGIFLCYLYYRFDTQPWWFKAIWKASDIFRRGFSKLPHKMKVPLSALIAMLVYWPLARLSGLLEKTGMDVTNIPLSHYRTKSLYTMKTDALDRFGTSLEHRFTRVEIKAMMEQAGFTDVVFSDRKPFWCATGRRG